MSYKISIFWFRRDLRIHDNHGLFRALSSGEKVLPIFIFDKIILDELPKDDQRVTFIHNCIEQLQEQLLQFGSNLKVFIGNPLEVLQELLGQHPIKAIYSNEDYEPYATERDQQICEMCSDKNVAFYQFKDQVVFHKEEVVKENGTPYLVYTPYMKAWKKNFEQQNLPSYDSEKHVSNFIQSPSENIPTLAQLGFERSLKPMPTLNLDFIDTYDQWRNTPAIQQGSNAGVFLRFGTISIRQLVKHAKSHNEVFLNELIWREFFSMLLWFYPSVITQNFKRQYDGIAWENDHRKFELWCKGQTGYLLVDAGIKQLLKTGLMHNRVRMVVASFLTKNLLIDWRWGEAFFAEKLLDYELASNVMNWQWVAGTGVDAAPYFRVFNPESQAEKFDPNQEYIKRWLTTDEMDKTLPIVDLGESRKRAIATYKEALNE